MMNVYEQMHLAMLLVTATIVYADTSGLAVPERRMRLLGDEASFRDAFSRFGPNDKQNGLTLEKLARRGQEAYIQAAYSDGTVTVRFDDGLEYDVPIEAVEARAPTKAPPEIVEFGSSDGQFLQHNCSSCASTSAVDLRQVRLPVLCLVCHLPAACPRPPVDPPVWAVCPAGLPSWVRPTILYVFPFAMGKFFFSRANLVGRFPFHLHQLLIYACSAGAARRSKRT